MRRTSLFARPPVPAVRSLPARVGTLFMPGRIFGGEKVSLVTQAAEYLAGVSRAQLLHGECINAAVLLQVSNDAGLDALLMAGCRLFFSEDARLEQRAEVFLMKAAHDGSAAL